MICPKWLPALLLLVACQGCSNSPPPLPPLSTTWQTYGGSEPSINGNQFQFPTTSAGTAGYFFKFTPASVGQTVTFTYSIDGNDPQWAQHPQSGSATDSNPASVTLFLWRTGDDLMGDKASYRFWCPQRNLLKLGDNQTLSCKLDPNVWTNVFGSVDPNGFAAAMSNELGLGFTFGGANFYGHGVYLSSGTATFTINGFTVQ